MRAKPALLISGILVVLVIALHSWLVLVGPFPGDRWAAASFGMPASEAAVVQDMTSFYQSLGTAGPAIILISIIAWVLWRRALWNELGGLAVVCTAVGANAVLKLIFGPTPVWVATHHAGVSFPSGHTTFATAVIGYGGLLGYRHRQPELVLISALLVIGMGPARVLSGAHLVSDVVAGYMLGAAWLLLAVAWLQRDEWSGPQAGTTVRRRPAAQ